MMKHVIGQVLPEQCDLISRLFVAASSAIAQWMLAVKADDSEQELDDHSEELVEV